MGSKKRNGGFDPRPGRWAGPYARCAWILLVFCFSNMPSTSSSEAQVVPSVRVEGGPDESGHNYTWTVRHEHTAPLVSITIPHFRADLFTVPEGWSQAITNRYGEGGGRGVCRGTIKTPGDAIRRGKSAVFTLRIAAEGAQRGEGDVVLRFADGVEVVVRAQVPVAESLSARYVSLVGLGSIFAVFLLVRSLRSRRRPT